MNKTKFSFITLGLCSVMALTSIAVFAGTNRLVRTYGSMTYKHFNAVAPTVTGNGSKEYWTDCSGGAPLFEAPEGATIVDGGTPSAEWVAALEPTDSRYVRPTREEFDVVRDGSNFYPSVGHGTSEPFNYYFFDTAAATAVISVQVPAALINGGGSTTVGGIVVTGGGTIGAEKTGGGNRAAEDYASFNFGIATLGLKTYSHNGWYKGRAPGDDWILPNLYYDKTTKESIAGQPRELTIVLENNKFGAYIDGKFIYEFSSGDTSFFDKAITNSTYRFGVYFGATATGTTMALNRELYGDDATSYIRQQLRYNMSKSGNAYSTISGATRRPAYWYLDGVYSDTIVAELSAPVALVDKSASTAAQIFYSVGFIFTDGETISTADVSSLTGMPAGEVKNLIVGSNAWGAALGSNFINMRHPSAWGNRGGDKFAALLYNKSSKDQTIDTAYNDSTVTLTNFTITAIYKGGKLHCYINGVYIAGYVISETNVTYYGHGGTLAANAKLKVGAYMLGFQQASGAITVTKYMVGSAAAVEITANYSEAA